MLKRLFTSYSRRDGRQVAEIVRLLRVTGAYVFRDEDSIQPGKKWRTEISEALTSADTVLVFWGRNAQASEEVRTEYEQAINLGKDIVPILLEPLILPPALADYQYVDFSELNYSHSPEGLKCHADQLASTLMKRIFQGAETKNRPRSVVDSD